MKAIDNALTLRGARYFKGVGVVGEQFLIDAGGAAYGGHGGEAFGLTEHCGGRERVLY